MAAGARSADHRLPGAPKPYYQTIVQDGLFDAVATKAQELGVSTAQMQGILHAYMSGAAEMGLLEPVIDVAAERAGLLPDVPTALAAIAEKGLFPGTSVWGVEALA